MKITIELETDRYFEAESGDLSVLLGCLPEIEVRQADGLLSCTRRITGVEALSGAVSHTLGLPRGPAIRVFLTQENT